MKKYLAGIKNSTYLLGAQFYRQFLAFFVAVHIGRTLGPNGYGEINFALSILSILSSIVLFGQQTFVPRGILASKTNYSRSSLISNGFYLSIFLGIIISSITWIGYEISSISLITLVVILSILFKINDVLSAVYISEFKSKVVFRNIIVVVGLISFLRFFFVKTEKDILIYALSFPLEGLLFFCLYCIKFPYKLISKFSFVKIREITVNGLPLLISGISLTINQRVDQIIIKRLIDFSNVGYYATAVKLIEVIYILPYVAARGFFPSFFESYKKNKDKFKYDISVAYKVAFSIGIFCSLGIYVFAESIILFLFTEKYFESISLLKLYSIACPFAFIGSINSLYLRVTGNFKSIMHRQFINVFVNLGLNFSLIPLIGTIGAVVSTLSSLIISTILFDLFAHRELSNLKFFLYK